MCLKKKRQQQTHQSDAVIRRTLCHAVKRLTAAADMQTILEERVRDSGFMVLLAWLASVLTELPGVVPADSSRGTAPVITRGEGLFRTTYVDASWEAVNLGRDVSVRAKQIKVIVVQGPTLYALAILSTKPDADLNTLFMRCH